jgi:glycerophosphoryl diester phosphodiesterase
MLIINSITPAPRFCQNSIETAIFSVNFGRFRQRSDRRHKKSIIRIREQLAAYNFFMQIDLKHFYSEKSSSSHFTVCRGKDLEIPFFKQINDSALKRSYYIVMIKPRTTVTCVLELPTEKNIE